MQSIYDFTVKDMQDNEIELNQLKDYIVLIVNTASKCGFTPQFEGLEALYKQYQNQNFIVLGFPCNQFGQQDPGSNAEILEFCQLNYDVSFPMLAKIEVNGENEAPLYTYLKSSKGGIFNKKIKWNFTKFLINRNGLIVKRFSPTTPISKIEKEIKKLL